MLRFIAAVAALAVTAPVTAQVRVTVNGQTMDVPAGIVRTVVTDAQGRQHVTDRPWDGSTVPGAASITTVETTEEDDRGRVLSRTYETRIEPQRVAYVQPVVHVVQQPVSYAPSPPPRIEPDMAALDDDAPASAPEIIRVRRSGWSGHFVADVRINGVKVKAIIDTGAAYTILTPEAARQVGADETVFRTEAAVGIGGMTSVGVTKLRSLEIGGQRFGGIVARIGQSGIPYTLLGQTEIARLGRVVIEDGVMTIIPRGAQLASR